jgi:hypothetical protein
MVRKYLYINLNFREKEKLFAKMMIAFKSIFMHLKTNTRLVKNGVEMHDNMSGVFEIV